MSKLPDDHLPNLRWSSAGRERTTKKLFQSVRESGQASPTKKVYRLEETESLAKTASNAKRRQQRADPETDPRIRAKEREYRSRRRQIFEKRVVDETNKRIWYEQDREEIKNRRRPKNQILPPDEIIMKADRDKRYKERWLAKHHILASKESIQPGIDRRERELKGKSDTTLREVFRETQGLKLK